jgi:AmiR/NasT family two-component response regulator
VNQFRSLADTCGITIVALTDVHAPSWLRQEENPGLDGFLVKPLNRDILSSLVQSAWIRQAYCSSH